MTDEEKNEIDIKNTVKQLLRRVEILENLAIAIMVSQHRDIYDRKYVYGVNEWPEDEGQNHEED